MSVLNPLADDVWFLPLGGCGEIGMNMNLYGHDDSWLMVDCGVTFRDADGSNRSGHDIQMADPEFISSRREQLAGLLLTHAHEDHIGAVPHLWPRLQCPVYATAFTAEMLRRKLVEHGLDGKVPIHLVEAGDRFSLGSFDVHWVPHTHSIPDPCGIVLTAHNPAATRIFHTADWKLDEQPLIGHHFSEATYRALGKEGIDALVCDSTSAVVDGFSISESALLPGLREIIGAAEGRVIVTCFGTNIARLHSLATVANDVGRHLGLLGRSLINTIGAARTVGLWKDQRTLVSSEHLAYLPRETLLLAATGSQGEARAALGRLSRNAFRDLQLEPGDTVIFSARAIPGNEDAIAAIVERFRQRGIHVIQPQDTELAIHASGHPAIGELERLYEWTQPRVLIPVHGEDDHLEAQQAVARDAGIRTRLVGRNGDLFVLSPGNAIRRGTVTTRRLGVTRDGKLQSIA